MESATTAWSTSVVMGMVANSTVGRNILPTVLILAVSDVRGSKPKWCNL